ncbi:lipid A biosynthesis lauroyl acyltransferase [Sulfurimonas sp. HSL-1716]|uniref:lipid A biosynthesis lauroyl acyltransferase n=1 Tax=Hydrocurvibacter sulfurireducens TaxID=3131937 RepID=UPI0031F8308C
MIGFYLFLVLEKFLMLLPKRTRRSFFIGLASLAYMLSKRYTKVVRQNLEFVYGNGLDEKFIEEVTKYSYKSLLLNFLYTLEGRYYSIDDIAKKVKFENLEIIKKVQEEKRPIIFVTAHYGAWELGAEMLSACVEPIMVVYKGMNNKYFEKYLLSSRAKWNMDYAEKHGAAKELVKRLRAKKAIAILIDTNVNKQDGIEAEFLNHPTLQIKSTAYLARKFDAALIPILIHADENDENYTIKVYDELVPPKTDDMENDILVSTQMQASWLSREILKNPKPWFWLHRRWKNDYPAIYKK